MTLMTVGLVGALVIVLGLAFAGVLSRIRAVENRPSTRVPHPYDDEWIRQALAGLAMADTELEGRVHDQTLAIAEGIERVARAESRVAEAVRRAKRRADEAGYTDPGIEAEVAGLQRVDGDGSEASSVPVLHQDLAPDVGSPSSIRGVTVEQLQRARGWT